MSGQPGQNQIPETVGVASKIRSPGVELEIWPLSNKALAAESGEYNAIKSNVINFQGLRRMLSTALKHLNKLVDYMLM